MGNIVAVEIESFFKWDILLIPDVSGDNIVIGDRIVRDGSLCTRSNNFFNSHIFSNWSKMVNKRFKEFTNIN